MRIFQITMDSSCFAASETKQAFPNEIKQLIEWNSKGWVDLIKSDVLEKETEELSKKSAGRTSLKGKTKTLATDYGIPLLESNGEGLISHTSSNWGFNQGKSNFEEIRNALWGRIPWQNKNKIRDAVHLDTHLINERDFFVTNDKKDFLNNKNILKEEFNAEIMNPAECVNKIQEYWSIEPGDFPGSCSTLPPRIIGGTNIFVPCLNLPTLGRKPIFLVQIVECKFYLIQGILYDSSGDIIAEFKDDIVIAKDNISLHCLPDDAREAKILIIEKGSKLLSPHIVVLSGTEKLLEAKVLGDGSLWVFGKFYNETGKKNAYLSKDCIELNYA